MGLGPHDAQIYYLLPTISQWMEYCFRWVWEASSASLVPLHSCRRPHVLVAPIHVYMGCQSRPPGSLTLVSATTKHISPQWACNIHLSIVELLNATGQTGNTAPGDLLHFVRVYYWTTVEWKELLPGSSLSHLDYGSRIHNLYLVFGIGNVAITISMVLLPCAVSSAWTWVNQPLTLVQRLG